MLVIDRKNYLVNVDGKDVILSPRQWNMLIELADADGFIHYTSGADRVCLSRLRSKIGTKYLLRRNKIGLRLNI